jgi:hypothetical protein
MIPHRAGAIGQGDDRHASPCELMLVHASALTLHSSPRSMTSPRRVPRKPDATGLNLMHAGSLFRTGEAQMWRGILRLPRRAMI